MVLVILYDFAKFADIQYTKPQVRYDWTPPQKKYAKKKTKPEVLWLNVYGYYRLARQPGWWFQIFFSCTKKLGEDETHFD